MSLPHLHLGRALPTLVMGRLGNIRHIRMALQIFAQRSPQHAHHHQQEEMFLVSEGEVQVTIAGNVTKLGPGSAAFIAAGDQHQIANVGARPAQYFEIILDPPSQH